MHKSNVDIYLQICIYSASNLYLIIRQYVHMHIHTHSQQQYTGDCAVYVWVWRSLFARYFSCCIALQCVAVRGSVLQCVAVCCSVLQCVAVQCSVLQCVVVCCSVLQCVAIFVFVCIHVHFQVSALVISRLYSWLTNVYIDSKDYYIYICILH